MRKSFLALGMAVVSARLLAQPILVKDISPGPAGSAPQALFGWGSRLFFSAESAQHGRELWTSDGTAEGTRLVADIVPGPTGSRPRDFLALDDGVAFVVGPPSGPQEIWSTDGSAAGTRKLGGPFQDLGAYGSSGRLWFRGRLYAASTRLLVLDGITTTEIGPVLASTGIMGTMGRLVVFGGTDPEHGAEPWVTDGTPAGTRLLRDLCEGSCSSLTGARRLKPFGPSHFFAAVAAGRPCLARTNGLTEGTECVWESPTGEYLQVLGSAGDSLFLAVGATLYVLRSPVDTPQPLLSTGMLLGSPFLETSTGSIYGVGIQGFANPDLLLYRLEPDAPSLRILPAWGGAGAVAGEDLFVATGALGRVHGSNVELEPLLHGVQEVARVGDRLFFNGDDGTTGVELWTRPLPGGSGFYPVVPCRALDTRTGSASLLANVTRRLPLTGLCGIGPGARAAALNITTVNATTDGTVAVHGIGTPVPTGAAPVASPKRTHATFVSAAVVDEGIALTPRMPSGRVDVIVDVLGFFR